jgi:hypothetical protein
LLLIYAMVHKDWTRHQVKLDQNSFKDRFNNIKAFSATAEFTCKALRLSAQVSSAQIDGMSSRACFSVGIIEDDVRGALGRFICKHRHLDDRRRRGFNAGLMKRDPRGPQSAHRHHHAASDEVAAA